MPKKMETTVEQSKTAIRNHLRRYRAKEATFVDLDGAAAVEFIWRKRRVRMVLPLPGTDVYLRSPSSGDPMNRMRIEHHEDTYEVRRRWRPLAALIRAKLYAVQAGVCTFKQEFGGDLAGKEDK